MLILARVASAAAPALLGDITVTELQADTNRVPQYYGEWFELRNSYAGTLEFDDVTITRSSGDSITIGSVIVASGDYLVLGVSQNTTYGDADFNGNVPVDVIYPFADFNISAAADSLTVAYGGTLLDEVVWDSSWGVSVDYAHAASLNAFDLEWANDFSLNWCPSATFITVSGMYGSPGVDNDYCGSSPGVDNDGDGYSEREGDCRDDDASIHPGAVDGTDGVPQSAGGGGNPNDDADCDGVRDNGVVDGDGDGYTETDGDCDDGDASIHPGASDIEGDGIDQNCDGADAIAELDDDGDGYNYSDCNDDDPTINPGATEVCDDADNDCDLLRDEDVKVTWFDDADGDGFGDPSAEHDGCTPPEGSVENGEDCDDADADRFPGNVEVCDARDNDCDDATYDPLECGDDTVEDDPECGCTTTVGVPWLAFVSALAFVRVRRTSSGAWTSRRTPPR